MSPRAPRHHPSPDALLAYAVGGADAALRVLVDVHLEACEACAREAGTLAEPGGSFLAGLRPEPVPDDLFRRIQAALPGPSAAVPEADLPLPAAVARLLPPPESRSWRGVLGRGLRVLSLLEAPSQGIALLLVRLQAGAAFPEHTHAGLEDTLLLAGGAVDGNLDLEAGDWRRMEAASRHAPRARPGEDCWILVRVEGGVAFRGWRRLFASA